MSDEEFMLLGIAGLFSAAIVGLVLLTIVVHKLDLILEVLQ